MPSRPRRVVASLFALALVPGLMAAEPETFVLRGEGFSVTMGLAPNELHAEAPAVAAGGAARVKGRAVVLPGGDRAALADTARALLATGQATRVEPVLYLDGRLADANARIIPTRRILIEAAPGHNVQALAGDHGLRVTEAVDGRPGWWIAEPISAALLAALDATASLHADPRTALAWPLMQMPVSRQYDPNDPVYTHGGVPGFMWHLADAPPGIRVREVWNLWKGEGTNIAISDTGTQGNHPDLIDNFRSIYSYDYFFNDPDPSPASPTDNHGTAVAGTALAVGDNNLGVVGVAYRSGLIASKLLHDYNPNAINADTLPPDDRVRAAMRVRTGPGSASDLTWANNNSWGPGGAMLGVLAPLIRLGMSEAVRDGRNGHGVPLIFAAGNSGWSNPNDLVPLANYQAVTAFSGYLNLYTFGVAALAPTGGKAPFSTTGPSLLISAPGVGIVTTDRTGDAGYINRSWQQSDFNFDGIAVYSPNNPALPPPAVQPLPFENGDYHRGIDGTSFAAPIVSGVAALMQQARPQLSWRDLRHIMAHRGQDVRPPPFGGSNPPLPHDDWGFWRPNAVNLMYNNWYGFGAVDAGRFVFGGTGAQADRYATTARDEPGALRWPLLPALLPDPLTATKLIPQPPESEVHPQTYGAEDPGDVYDAPDGPMGYNPDLVLDGRPFESIPPSRWRNIDIVVPEQPDRFRVEAVELRVVLRGKRVGANWGDYLFHLTSPSGTRCILGRQRPGGNIPLGTTWDWTFNEFFHLNEPLAAGTWTLHVIDERNNLANTSANEDVAFNPAQVRVERVDIAVHGFQTYPRPNLGSTTRQAVPSDAGNQVFDIFGSGFGRSAGGVDVTQAYWHPDAFANTPVELPTTVITETHLRVTLPNGLLPTASPGEGFVAIANPSLAVGRTATGAAAIDAFDADGAVPVILPSTVTAPDRRMKRCPDEDVKRIRYSRQPTLTPIPDLSLTTGGTFNVSTVAFDPDVIAGLGTPVAETLSVSVVSYNPFFISPGAITVTGPGVNGIGTWTISGSTNGSQSGFALIEVRVTDGVLTTSQAFRIIIPSDSDASGCGGGMGLALLGVPLAVWLIRRRRRA